MMRYGDNGYSWGMGWGGWLLIILLLINCAAVLGGVLYVVLHRSSTDGRPRTR